MWAERQDQRLKCNQNRVNYDTGQQQRDDRSIAAHASDGVNQQHGEHCAYECKQWCQGEEGAENGIERQDKSDSGPQSCARRSANQEWISQRIAQHALEGNAGNAQRSPDECRTKEPWPTYLP